MDNLYQDMLDKGLIEVSYNPPVMMTARGNLIFALTKPYQVKHSEVIRASLVSDHQAGKGVLSFPNIVGMAKVSNVLGGLN